MPISNGLFIPIVQVPLQETGWEIRVLPWSKFEQKRPTTNVNMLWGPPLAVISTYIEAVISPEISGVGLGAVTMDLDAEFWNSTLSNGTPATMLLEYEHLWQVFEGDKLRFEFLGREITETFLEDSETRGVVISGPGGADVLRWGRVFTPLYPKAPVSTKVASITGTANFDTDKYFLTAKAKGVLNGVVKDIYGTTPKITIVGHTDSRESEAYNLILSRSRAQAAAEYLRSKIPKAKIAAIGKGESQPIASNSTASGRAQNRRVTIAYPHQQTITTDIATYQFYDIPAMKAYLKLLTDCWTRGTIKFVVPTFSGVKDSSGIPWDDTPASFNNTTVETATASSDVLFATASSKVTAAGINQLKVLVGKIKAANELKKVQGTGAKSTVIKITCTGHADSRGSRPYNQALSERRAKAVAYELTKQVAGSTSKLKYNSAKKTYYAPGVVVVWVGKGETKPIATNRTAAGQKKNRRVTVTYPGFLENPDRAFYAPQMGQDLLSLLQEWTGGDPNNTSPLRAEWFMHPGFRLDVRRKFGKRRDKHVVFYEGSISMVSKSRARSREPITNLIAIRNDYGKYWVKTNVASVKRWRQREYFEQPSGTFDSSAMALIAQKRMELNSIEKSTWTVTVPAYAPGRRVFVDYQLGDYVGISRYREDDYNVVDPFRVLAISLKIDQEGAVDTVELTLQSVAEAKADYLQQQITSILNHQKKGPLVYIQSMAPWGAKPGDLWVRE